jgi:hypothetical protein
MANYVRNITGFSLSLEQEITSNNDSLFGGFKVINCSVNAASVE